MANKFSQSLGPSLHRGSIVFHCRLCVHFKITYCNLAAWSWDTRHLGTDKWMSSLLCGAGCGATHLTIFRCVWAIFIKTEKPLSDWGRLHRTLPFIFIDYVDPDFNTNKRSVKPGRMKYKTALLLGWGTVLQERLARVLNWVLLQLIIFFFVSVYRLTPGGIVFI